MEYFCHECNGNVEVSITDQAIHCLDCNGELIEEHDSAREDNSSVRETDTGSTSFSSSNQENFASPRHQPVSSFCLSATGRRSRMMGHRSLPPTPPVPFSSPAINMGRTQTRRPDATPYSITRVHRFGVASPSFGSASSSSSIPSPIGSALPSRFSLPSLHRFTPMPQANTVGDESSRIGPIRTRQSMRRGVLDPRVLNDSGAVLVQVFVTRDASGIHIGVLQDREFTPGQLDLIVREVLTSIGEEPHVSISPKDIARIPMSEVTEKEASELTQCATCMENFIAQEKVARLDCDHIFHRACIVPWLKERNTCPVCRGVLDPEKWGDTEIVDLDDSSIKEEVETIELD